MAVMLCRRVQVERPSWSTSGGQSGGGAGSGVMVCDRGEEAVVGGMEVDEEEEEEGWDLVRAAQEAMEVQVRQLWCEVQ